MLSLNHFPWQALHLSPHHKWAQKHFSPYLLSDDRMGAHYCYNHTRSRTGTTRWRAWRILQWVRSRPMSPSQLWLWWIVIVIWCILFSYFVQNPYHVIKMWHWFLYHELSYVWDLILAHILGAPGFVLNFGCDNWSGAHRTGLVNQPTTQSWILLPFFLGLFWSCVLDLCWVFVSFLGVF
jgi:hypothetical protein